MILTKKRENSFRPTKVAILDNGILSVSPTSSHDKEIAGFANRMETTARAQNNRNETPVERATSASTDNAEQPDQSGGRRALLQCIKEGRSFVDGNSRLSPWLFASNPHGTQMANLLCAIDPFCELYVGRVAEEGTGITSKRVAQVCPTRLSSVQLPVLELQETMAKFRADFGRKGNCMGKTQES